MYMTSSPGFESSQPRGFLKFSNYTSPRCVEFSMGSAMLLTRKDIFNIIFVDSKACNQVTYFFASN